MVPPRANGSRVVGKRLGVPRSPRANPLVQIVWPGRRNTRLQERSRGRTSTPDDGQAHTERRHTPDVLHPEMHTQMHARALFKVCLARSSWPTPTRAHTKRTMSVHFKPQNLDLLIPSPPWRTGFHKSHWRWHIWSCLPTIWGPRKDQSVPLLDHAKAFGSAKNA